MLHMKVNTHKWTNYRYKHRNTCNDTVLTKVTWLYLLIFFHAFQAKIYDKKYKRKGKREDDKCYHESFKVGPSKLCSNEVIYVSNDIEHCKHLRNKINRDCDTCMIPTILSFIFIYSICCLWKIIQLISI